MSSLRQESASSSLQDKVRAQARVRMILGCPVLVLILTAIVLDGPSNAVLPAWLIASYAVLYLAYNAGAYLLVERPRVLPTHRLVVVTAVLDPLLLSGWLSLMGPSSVLFVCFYLFTILGYGFRTGVGSMRICQAASLAGFIGVVLVSPVWRDQVLVASSNLIFLTVVPLYATSLIRSLHQARKQAQNESRTKTQLLANVSHELRTPLAGIVSSAQLIQEDTSESATGERVSMILDLAGELNKEIDQLLDAAKYHTGLVTVEAAPVALRALLDRVDRALLPIARIKGIGFSIRLDERLRQAVVVDARLLVSVLVNLGGNAIKFTERGRADICVDLVEDSEATYGIRFSVTDTGIGIPNELQTRVFEPFFQVSSGTRRAFGGTGLGTSIAKEIVAQLGGELRLLSEPGKGSEFWFELTLPKADVIDVDTSAPDAADATQTLVHGLRVLVVDDNGANLKLLCEMLSKDAHTVTSAHSGTHALQCLSKDDFDVMLLDFNMADMDGAELYQLYCFGVSQPVRTIFVTADTSAQTAQRLLGLGAAAVLHKPVRFDVLRRTLASVLGHASAVEPVLQPSADAPAPLRVVPVEYLDRQAIEAIREISDDPAFLSEMIDAGVTDLERLEPALIAAIEAQDMGAVRDRAHAVKGVSVNLGATRLASLADRLMSIDADELRAARGQWCRDVRATTLGSVERLRTLQAAA